MTMSNELVVYQPMDAWLQALASGGERREGAVRGSVQDCPLHQAWAVNVRVVSTEETAWPEAAVTLEVDLDEGVGHLFPTRMTGPVSASLLVDGVGVDRGRTGCQLRAEDWEVAEAPGFALPADNGKTLDVKIRPRPWIALRVRRHDRDEVLPGVKVALKLPAEVAHTVTTADATVRVAQEFTRYGSVDVTGATVPDGFWEVAPLG